MSDKANTDTTSGDKRKTPTARQKVYAGYDNLANKLRHKIYARHENVAYDSRLSIKLIKRCICDALQLEGVNMPCEISVLIVDNEAIKELNSSFRGIDTPTDVLSFPLQELNPGDFAALSDSTHKREPEGRALNTVDRSTGENTVSNADKSKGVNSVNTADKSIGVSTYVTDEKSEEKLKEYTSINSAVNAAPPPLPLGDIVISAERLREQAIEFEHSLERETAYLTIHSVLHLLGYDHIDEAEEKKLMRSREKEILALIDGIL